VLTEDGHCSYSPDRQWVLTDTYPDDRHERTLLLYHPESGRRLDLGRFHSPPALEGECRCDLHPRWSRDGRRVCFDSAHEGTRQMYVLDVTQWIEGRA
jgi:Tol biopolymer transport system component